MLSSAADTQSKAENEPCCMAHLCKGKGRLLLLIAAADVGAKAEVCCKSVSGMLVLWGERVPSFLVNGAHLF